MNFYKPQPGQHITILGLGPSLEEYSRTIKGLGSRKAYTDQVWAINALGDLYQCDLVFHMDDLEIQRIRAAARPESNIAAMVAWLEKSKTPVMTSRAYDKAPCLVEFPLQEVLQNLQFPYFNSTTAYAVAYAIHCQASKISLFGIDYTYPDAHDAEKGRACVEFWLGQAAARGIKIGMPKTTALMDAIYSQQQRLYGYDTRLVDVSADNGLVEVSFSEIEKKQLPTADEIEQRYCHKKHPNALVEGDTHA